MKPLIGLWDGPLPQAIGLAVLHSLWEGALLAAALACVLSCLRSSRLRYVTAYSGLVIQFCWFLATLWLQLPESQHGVRIPMQIVSLPWRDAAAQPFSPLLLVSLPLLTRCLTAAWLAGVLACCARWSVASFSCTRLRRRGVCGAPVPWQAVTDRLRGRLKIVREVTLLESFLTNVPLVVGHFRPVILVPLGFLTGMPPDQAESILLHELAHIARSDYLFNSCQRLLEALLFYHPAVWWMSRLIQQEREHCCDDMVIESGLSPQCYAQALTALERNRIANWSMHPGTLSANGGTLMKRIARLLNPTAHLRPAVPVLVTFVVLATAGALAAGLRGRTVHLPFARQTVAFASTSWQNWLNQDVVYIISDEEKAAFQHLKTDEERQHFIDQFWEHRNPNPGSPRNSFKEECYRRIAFANDRYKTLSGTPGWQTDRGHIYIVYGPPDEIVAHPKNGEAPYGSEEWIYRDVPGAGKTQFFFFDRTGGNDYRLGPARLER